MKLSLILLLAMSITTARKQAQAIFGPFAYVGESTLPDKRILRTVSVVSRDCQYGRTDLMSDVDTWESILSRAFYSNQFYGRYTTHKVGDVITLPIRLDFMTIDDVQSGLFYPPYGDYTVTDAKPGVHIACSGGEPHFFKVVK